MQNWSPCERGKEHDKECLEALDYTDKHCLLCRFSSVSYPGLFGFLAGIRDHVAHTLRNSAFYDNESVAEITNFVTVGVDGC